MESKSIRKVVAEALENVSLEPSSGRRSVAFRVMVWVLLALAAVYLARGVLNRLQVDPQSQLLGWLLALIPALFYAVFVYLLDRNEKEPLKLLLDTILWGAIVSFSIAVWVQDSVLPSFPGMEALLLLGPWEQIIATFLTPLTEELAKASILVLLLIVRRNEFDDVMDGIIYGAMVGIGFALSENAFFLSTAINSLGLDAVTDLFIARAVLGGITGHAMYAALTGMGLGYLREKLDQKPLRPWHFAIPVAGLMLAVMAHGLWNVLVDPTDIYSSAAFIGGPFLLLIGSAVLFAWRREDGVITQQLSYEVAAGLMTQDEVREISTWRRRVGAQISAWSDHGLKQWRLVRKYQRALIELAFRRWHLSSSPTEEIERDALIAGYRARARESKSQLDEAVKSGRRLRQGVMAVASLCLLLLLGGGFYSIATHLRSANEVLAPSSFYRFSAALSRRAPSNQTDPAIAYNSERGEYLIVWSDDRGSTGETNVYAKRIWGNGLPKGSASSGRFRIVGGTGNQDQPAIAYNEERDEYLIVWSDNRNPDTGRDIYGQRLFTNGLPKGGFFPTYVGPGNQAEPAIAYSPFRDEYLVVWSDDRDGRMDIYGRRLGTTGLATRGEEFLIATGDSNKQEPALAFTGEGYLVVWTDDRGENLDILGKRAHANGLPIGGAEGYDFGAAIGPGNDMAAALPTTNAGVLVWSGDANADVTGLDLFGILLFGSGLPIEGSFTTISAPEANQSAPALAFNPAEGRFLVVWTDDRDDTADLYGLLLRENGLPVGGEYPIVSEHRDS